MARPGRTSNCVPVPPTNLSLTTTSSTIYSASFNRPLRFLVSPPLFASFSNVSTAKTPSSPSLRPPTDLPINKEMTTYNTTFDWDTNLPPSISSLDENDFLLLLQKQFPVVNSGDHPIAPSALSKERPVVGTNPQSLNKFPIPASNSPLSTDSSPSPPGQNDDGSTNGSTDHNHHKRSDSGDDDHNKRKASADDFEDDIGQPSSKSQHTDSKSKKSSNNSRRKSGEKSQDESRLLKRKEQNRAAQRAFRERKEKHVKDLEDKVAQLEAKTETQATENENLRDMLSRLQNENVMLKQSTFTFSVPSASTSTAGSSNTVPASATASASHNTSTQNRRDSGIQSGSLNHLFSNDSLPGPSSMPASAGSSIRTASTHDSPSSLFENFDNFSGLHKSEVAPSSSSISPANHNSTSTPDLDTIAYFGAPGPFTTISSNPMFTSYRDPALSMNAFASFGGWDGDVTMAGTSSTHENPNSGFEGLFGDQFSGLVPFSSDFLNPESSSGSPSGSSAAARLSPVVHKTKPAGEHQTTCPKTKEDIERLVATGHKSTFGSPPSVHEQLPSGTPACSGSGAPSRRHSDYDTAVDQAFGITPKKDNENCNIDELCQEMQRKAKCSYTATTGSQ